VVDIDDVFTYDPTVGPLLLDIKMFNSPDTTQFDATGTSTLQTATTRIYSDPFDSNVNDPCGIVNYDGSASNPYGLVTMLCFDGAAPLMAPGGGESSPVVPVTERQGYEPDRLSGTLGRAESNPATVAQIGERASTASVNPAGPKSTHIRRSDSSARVNIPVGPQTTNSGDERPVIFTGHVLSDGWSEAGGTGCGSILYAPTEDDDAAYRAAVSAACGGATVDYYDARVDTPNVPLLSTYACVFTWVNGAYADKVQFGDNLADYVDAGGKVILGQWCYQSDQYHWLEGRIMTAAYCPVTISDVFSGSYAGDGTDCVHDGVTAYDTSYLDIATLLTGNSSDGTFNITGGGSTLSVAWRPDRQVYYSTGNTGLHLGTGDWPQLLCNMCCCGGECYVPCPPGATNENEPDCGLPVDTVNGGCNSDPPVFSSISCYETVCGTAAWDGTTRDTDWYEIVITEQTEYTWTVEAEFPVHIGLAETIPAGSGDCEDHTGSLNPYAYAGECEEVSITTDCLTPGTYWFFVAPDFSGPAFACGKQYVATLTCVPCGSTFSRPEKLLWQIEIPADRVVIDVNVGKDYFPGKPNDTCFQYYVDLEPREVFWQDNYIEQTQDDIFWISIAAVYGEDYQHPWGWKTRPWHWMDDAVTFYVEGDPMPGIVIDPVSTEMMPLEYEGESYDVSFELNTDPNYIKWEQLYTGLRHWDSYTDIYSTGTEYYGELYIDAMAADDWLCRRRTPVSSIVWWGSYLGYMYMPCEPIVEPPIPPDYFLISVWTDVPASNDVNNSGNCCYAHSWPGCDDPCCEASVCSYDPYCCETEWDSLCANEAQSDPNCNCSGVLPYSHPGRKVWEYKAYDYDEVMVGYDKSQPMAAGAGAAAGMPIEPVFRYSVRMPEEDWFCQPDVNSIYWLGIVAVWDAEQGYPYPWGWTNHKHVFGDDGVQGRPEEEYEYDPIWHWEELIDPETGESWDLSFMLFTEPDYCCECADYNLDTVVNFLDYADFADDWLWSGQAGGYNNSDLNCDGVSDLYDLKILAEQWLQSCW
jgi:hypothetical protein